MLPGARRTSTSLRSFFLSTTTSLNFIGVFAQMGSPLRSAMSCMTGTLPVTVMTPLMTPLPVGAGAAAAVLVTAAEATVGAVGAGVAGLSSPLFSGQPTRAPLPTAITASTVRYLDMESSNPLVELLLGAGMRDVEDLSTLRYPSQ